MIFPKYYTDQLTEIFLKKEKQQEGPESPTNNASVDDEPTEEDVDGEPLEDVDNEPMDEDLDGEPLDEDLDGEPLEEEKEEKQNAEDIQISREEIESLYTNVKDMFSS